MVDPLPQPKLREMLQRLEFRAMGCEMLAAVDSEHPSSLLSKVPEWFEEWEQVLSRFRYNSELTRFNQTHGQPVYVSQVLWDVFQAARKAEDLTDGLVTPTLLDAINDAGYDRPFDVLPHQTTLKADPIVIAPQPLKAIAFNKRDHTIILPDGMGLDFGGVAKGWAAHQAMQRLQADGPALVDAGGDIAVSGARADGSPWQIGVADPFHPEEEIETLFIPEGGVATSGKDRRRWLRDGMLQHHIINPNTHRSAETDLLTVTVVAPDVMNAEAAAKAAFILGSREGMQWIEAHPRFAALFILDNGEILYSRLMENYITE